MYLYTLDTSAYLEDAPSSSEWSKHHFANAKNAFLLGDQYLLPKLRAAGHAKLLKLIDDNLPCFAEEGEYFHEKWTKWIAKAWKWTMPGAEEIKACIVNALVPSAVSVIENEHFRTLMRNNEDFSHTLLRAIAEKAAFK